MYSVFSEIIESNFSSQKLIINPPLLGLWKKYQFSI
jgi:hypothetical protein